jgi:hypothetical protein
MNQEESKSKEPNVDDSVRDEQTSPEWIEPEEGVFQAYSNLVHVNWTATDVIFRFAQIVPKRNPLNDASWAIEESAAVTMAWIQAKHVRAILNDIIQRYENVNGEIKTPTMPE